MSTVNTILILLSVAVALAIAVLLLIFRDYEHEKEKCGNCAFRDDTLHYCWSKTQEVGTEEKACAFFRKRGQI